MFLYIYIKLNVLVWANVFIFPSVLYVLVNHGYTNTNISSRWVKIQLNIFPISKQFSNPLDWLHSEAPTRVYKNISE